MTFERFYALTIALGVSSQIEYAGLRIQNSKFSRLRALFKLNCNTDCTKKKTQVEFKTRFILVNTIAFAGSHEKYVVKKQGSFPSVTL